MKRKADRDEEDNGEEEVVTIEEELTVRKRIDFEDSSDDEVVINRQAHKKRKISRDMEELKIWIKGQFEENKAETRKLVDTIDAAVSKGKKNEAEINNIKDSIANIERKMGIQSNSSSASYANAASSEPRMQRIMTRKIATATGSERVAFNKSRRSLRMWPIQGNSKEEIMESAVTFCCQALNARRESLGLISVVRTRSAPRGTAYMEIIAEFADNFARDDILSRGPMLAQYRDKEG